LNEKGRWQGEVWNRHKDGAPYLVMQNISAIKDSYGEIVQFAAVFHDITEAKRDEEEIKYQAYHDLLTGLANRALFNDRLKQAIGRANRDKKKVALLFIDVDDFKNINDNFGHHAGDLLLQGIGIRLTACVRETDTVSRYAGDEFVVIMENTKDGKSVASVAEKILRSLSEPYTYQGKKIVSTVSIGISIYPTDGESVEAMVTNADLAMYHVKDKNKNNFSFFTKSLNEQATRRHELEYKMREALERIEFTVYYQPKVSISSGKITSMEALVRWKSGNEIIPPSAFIPLAEDTGLIMPIGEFVLFSACEQLKAWQDMGYKDLTVSVNISARQIDNQNLLEVVRFALAETGLDANSLCLEFTETSIMEDMDAAITTLKGIKDLGVHISLDDFGTGYSSLSHLRTFPIDELKIDRFFIISVPDNREDSAIATTVISMAQNLNLRVVAEGVETKEQLDFLRSAGCDEIQGYLFSRPVPAKEMEKLLKDGKTLTFT
jgi:diguanylate cyclase (GGDEF)-like protein